MKRNKSDKAWMARHVRDVYVRQAAQHGYRSRAAYKLIELDQRDKLLRPGMRVLDLGAAPGGWSQVAAQRVGPHGLVVAVDRAVMQPLNGVTLLRGDIRELAIQAAIAETLGKLAVDLVMSDMAPNLSGIAATDAARAQELVELAMSVAQGLLKPGGCAVVKLFHGPGLDAVIARMKTFFASVSMRKPAASRSLSAEHYAVCKGFISP
jgi:23S rRNA (uridine2552-2'-O)-methyltransferase